MQVGWTAYRRHSCTVVVVKEMDTLESTKVVTHQK